MTDTAVPHESSEPACLGEKGHLLKVLRVIKVSEERTATLALLGPVLHVSLNPHDANLKACR
jgi:hypothetical protein